MRHAHDQIHAADRGQRRPGLDRDHRQAGLRRRQAEPDLQIERHEDRQPDDRADAEERAGGRVAHDPVGEHRQAARTAPRRASCASRSPAHSSADSDEQAEHLRRQPRIAPAAPGHRQHQRETRAHHQHRAQEVELVRPVVARQRAQR